MNCCVFSYCFDAAEWPSIRQTMSGAKTSVMGSVLPRLERVADRLSVELGLAAGLISHLAAFPRNGSPLPKPRWHLAGGTLCEKRARTSVEGDLKQYSVSQIGFDRSHA